jgi:adenylate cyclase
VPEAEGPPARLSAEELAAALGVDVDRVQAMVEAGVLRPTADGSFEPDDVVRAQVADSLGQAGLTLDLLRQGIEAGFVSFAQTGLVYPAPDTRRGPSLNRLAADLDLEPATLLRIVTAFGLARPDPDVPMFERDARRLVAFVEAWRPLGGDDLLVRAARAYGEGLRRATDGWVGLFEEAVMEPLTERVVPWEEMSRRALEPGVMVLRAAQETLPWLFDRLITERLNQLNFESVQLRLALSGITPPPPARPAAIVFADLAGYTRLTVEQGDEAAAAFATRLAEIADEVARTHGGRLVKLLGDGVMLHFPVPADAVGAALALREAVTAAGLPPTHTGIDAGAVIRRESDFFGRTVNVAARLAAQAGAGEVLVSAAVREAASSAPALAAAVRLEPLHLKGIPEPVTAYRLS